MNPFNFNKIYVIESLDPKEQTGKELYDDLLRWKESKNLKAELIQVEDKLEFYDAIFHIIEEHKEFGYYPILHIEVHGNKNGLELKSKEFLNWYDFYLLLVEINMHLGNHLFLTLAVCNGAYLMRQIEIEKPSPFYGFIGSFEESTIEDLMIRYSEFYNELLYSFNIYSATKRLIESNPEEISIYAYIGSEEVFNIVCENLKTIYSTEDIEQLINKEIENSNIKFKKTEDETNYRAIYKDLLINTFQTKGETYKNRFFMTDEFPENKERFNL